RFASRLIYSVLRQIFRLEFFHADVHPGNVLIMPGDVVGFVDFGLCDELDETVRQQQWRYLFAVYSRDVQRMYHALTEILIPGENTDIESFRRAFLAEGPAWLRATRSGARRRGPERDSRRSPIAHAMVRVMQLVRSHDLQIPPAVLSMYRTLLGAETVAYEMSASADLRTVGRRFFREARWDEITRAFQPGRVEAFWLTTFNLLRDSPGQLQQLLSDFSDGRFVLRVSSSESPH